MGGVGRRGGDDGGEEMKNHVCVKIFTMGKAMHKGYRHARPEMD